MSPEEGNWRFDTASATWAALDRNSATCNRYKPLYRQLFLLVRRPLSRIHGTSVVHPLSRQYTGVGGMGFEFIMLEVPMANTLVRCFPQQSMRDRLYIECRIPLKVEARRGQLWANI